MNEEQTWIDAAREGDQGAFEELVRLYDYRQVLILREIHQRTYEEIASVCQLDLGTVKSRISRGRQRLRKILLENGNFSESDPSNPTEKEGCK